jgi:hypothetical protein
MLLGTLLGTLKAILRDGMIKAVHAVNAVVFGAVVAATARTGGFRWGTTALGSTKCGRARAARKFTSTLR